MQLKITLCASSGQIIPINYAYPLSAAIYRILAKADAEYADFLHEKGYGKGFKFFTFSDIRCPFKIQGDRLVLLENTAEFLISFYLPKASQNFIKGLFMSQQIEIADRISKGAFTIQSITALPDALAEKTEHEIIQLDVSPISPVVVGVKNEKGNYDFLSPEDSRFVDGLIFNWKEKIRALFPEVEIAKVLLAIEVQLSTNMPKSRLITIKSGTPQETKIRGFMNFSLKITAEKRFVEVLFNCGCGLYNSMGCGMVRKIKILEEK